MASFADKTSIRIRPLKGSDEVRAVEEMQRSVWGMDDSSIVPLNQLVAAEHVGGSLIGAFDGDKLVGFAYGFYGHIGGMVVHHSHMLAVEPEYRNHDLGFLLKAAQREQVISDGVTDRITWTFDPLQSANAHINFAKLGVVSDKYFVNVYTDSASSFLHRNGTDRLLVTWLLRSQRVEALIGRHGKNAPAAAPLPECPAIVVNSANARPERSEIPGSAAMLSIEIPSDINTLQEKDFSAAREWRKETRRAFTEALEGGFIVTNYLMKDGRTGAYILEQRSVESIA